MGNVKKKRIEKFQSLATDAWYGKVYKKLKPADVEICMDWLAEFGDSDDFGHHVNRIFVENFQDRKTNTKRDSVMWELLSVCYKL